MQNRNILSRWLPMVLVVLGVQPLLAQDGWKSISENDNRKARKEFLEVLKKDSTDRHALEGMLYLSDVESDDLATKKYANTLIKTYWDQGSYALYADKLEIKTYDLLLNNDKLTEIEKLPLRYRKAYALTYGEKAEEVTKAFRKLSGDHEWSVIGPFKNVAGSGHAIAYPVEGRDMNYDTAYYDETGMPEKWIKCQYRNPDGKIHFDYYLPESNEGVYYANTYLNNPKQQVVQLRIGRSYPAKIWLDDQLIFDGKETISFGYDNEWVQLQLPAGTHRLMVKYAIASAAPSGTRRAYRGALQASSYEFDMEDLDLSSLLSGYDLGGYRSRQENAKNMCIRITDTAGNLATEITSSFTGKYEPATYVTSLHDRSLIKFFASRLRKDSNDLFAWYGLMRAYEMSGLTLEGEEYFVKAYRQNSDKVFYKYLLASLYQDNEKNERYYEILNNIDADRTPVFAILYRKLNETDDRNDEEEWLQALKKLSEVTPGNFQVISSYIKYYDRKGMKQEKEDFIKEMEEKYPVYKYRLEYYLEKDKKARYEQKGGGLGVGDALSDLFAGSSDYGKLQRYKRKGRLSKVVGLYDKMITGSPYDVDYRKDKAEYLRDKEKYEDALVELDKAMQINPYNNKLYEIKGDVFADQEMKDSAARYYKKAKYYSLYSYSSFASVDKKLEKVEDRKPLKKIFSSKKFEDILAEKDWKMRYANEESVVLMYTRDLVLDEFNHVELFQKMMVKIMTEAGVNKWTEYDFSFLGNIGTVKIIKPSGAEVIPDMYGGYTVFKDLTPGDIIQLEGNYSWQPGGELDNELTLVTSMTFEAPVYYGKFEVAVPEGKYLGYLHQKLDSAAKRTRKEGYDFYTWEYNNIHKMEREEAMLDEYDLYGFIMISTMKDWGKVVNWYNNKTYRKLEATYEVREVLDSIIKPYMNDEQKVQAIYNYLTKDITYSFVPFLQSGYIPKRCGLTLSSRIGDCKDVATVMITMLRAVGIESYYTLVKTNMFDHNKYLPSQYFDHVIAGYYLNGKLNFLDMTTDFYPHYVLTEADANAWALLIKEGETDIFRLPKDHLDPKKNLVEIKVDAVLEADRSVGVKVRALQPGIAGGDIRERFARISLSEKKNLILERMGKGIFSNVDLVDYEFENLKAISDTLRSSYVMKANGFCDKVAGLLIFRAPYMTAIQSSQAMLSKKRFNRLDLESLGSVEPTRQVVNITFPKGYRLVEVPQNISLSSKYGEYKVNYIKTLDGIKIEKYQQFYVSQVSIEEFNEFKEYYLQLLDADATRMAIIKRANL